MSEGLERVCRRCFKQAGVLDLGGNDGDAAGLPMGGGFQSIPRKTKQNCPEVEGKPAVQRQGTERFVAIGQESPT